MTLEEAATHCQNQQLGEDDATSVQTQNVAESEDWPWDRAAQTAHIVDMKERLGKLEERGRHFEDNGGSLRVEARLRTSMEKLTKADEHMGCLYQKVTNLEEKLESTKKEHLEKKLANGITKDRLEHSNMLLEVCIQELEEQNQQGPESPGKAYYHNTDEAKGSELLNAKNSEPHKWEPGKEPSRSGGAWWRIMPRGLTRGTSRH